MRLRRLAPPDRGQIAHLLEVGNTFNHDEIRVALEVIDDAIAEPDKDYHVLVAEDPRGRVLSYVCWGPTPMTEATYDLYWVATHPEARGQGLASRLLGAMEGELPAREKRPCTVRIETSQLESYGAARHFYTRAGYAEVGRIADFYKAGDDLVIFAKRLEPRVRVGAAGPEERPQRAPVADAR